MSCSDSMVSVPPVLTSMRSAVAVAPRNVVSPSAFSEMFWPVSVVFCQVLLSEFALLLPTLASAYTYTPVCAPTTTPTPTSAPALLLLLRSATCALPASSRMSPAESRLRVLPALRLPYTTWMSPWVLVRLTLPPPWMVEPRETMLLPSALLLAVLKPMPASARNSSPLPPRPDSAEIALAA